MSQTEHDTVSEASTEHITECPYCDFESEDKRKHANHVLTCGQRTVKA